MAASARLPQQQLGKNGPSVPRLGLGLLSLSGFYSLPDSDEVRLKFLSDAYELGETFWDTADEYKDSEDLLGKWFAANPEKRDSITLSTKFGFKGMVDSKLVIDSSPEYCRQALDKSLKRLGLPYVDIYYIHRFDKITPVEKTMDALVELKNAGKIKYIGLSECSADTLRRAHAVHPITCIQVEYSAFCLSIESPETGVLKTARELGVAVVCYSPIGNGFLTGTLQKKSDFTQPGDGRIALPWLKDENFEHNVSIVNQISDMAKTKGHTAPQLALAWLLEQGNDIFAIPGTKRIHYLKENLASSSIAISAEEDRRIRELSQSIRGGRVQALMGFDFGDTPPL